MREVRHSRPLVPATAARCGPAGPGRRHRAEALGLRGIGALHYGVSCAPCLPTVRARAGGCGPRSIGGAAGVVADGARSGGALALVLGSSDAFAKPTPSSEAGRPLIHNYSRRDFGAGVQQWDVTQDARGIMYFANNAGVLEFDGRSWRLIELPSRLDVRALASDSGRRRPHLRRHQRRFRLPRPDAAGQLQFTSLLPPTRGRIQLRPGVHPGQRAGRRRLLPGAQPSCAAGRATG